MSDPLSHLPFALAAGNGRVNGLSARTLVATGLSVLRRGVPIVRALQGRRSAILLPPGAAWVSALAASEGRCAVMLDPSLAPEALGQALGEHDVGVVFTASALSARLPRGVPFVTMDEAPAFARWHSTDGGERTIDLAMHAGLQLEGDPEAEGSAEAVWQLVSPAGAGPVMSHREVLVGAHAFAAEARLGPRDHALVLGGGVTIEALMLGVVAPLLAGARVTTQDEVAGARSALEGDGISLMVADLGGYDAVLRDLSAGGAALDAPVLQRCIATGGTDEERRALAARWRAAAGPPLLQRRPHGAG